MGGHTISTHNLSFDIQAVFQFLVIITVIPIAKSLHNPFLFNNFL